MSAEIDSKIAEVVFGINVIGIIPCERAYDGYGQWWTAPCEVGAELRPVYVNHCGCESYDFKLLPPPAIRLNHFWTCLSAVPEYSTDILFAFEVVEKLRESNIITMTSSNSTWTVVISQPGVKWNRATADTLPMAICLGAIEVYT